MLRRDETGPRLVQREMAKVASKENEYKGKDHTEYCLNASEPETSTPTVCGQPSCSGNRWDKYNFGADSVFRPFFCQ